MPRTNLNLAEVAPGGQLDPTATPYLIPQGEVAAWTAQFRRGKACGHDARARHEAARGDASWEAHGRRGVPALAALCAPVRGHEASGGGLAEAHGVDGAPAASTPSYWLSSRVVRGEERPAWECATHVKRVRRRWKPWRDEKGRARRKLETHVEQVPSYTAHETGRRWHEARAEGQRHRQAHVEACGLGLVQVSCAACGVVHEHKTFCGVVRLCPGCNQRRSMRMRARFALSLEVVLRNAEKSGSFNSLRPGGALGQKLVAVTLPHVVVAEREPVIGAWGLVALVREMDPVYWTQAARKVTAGRRIEILFGAWRRASQALQRWLRRPWRGVHAEPIGACWHRAFEWTPGADGMGHPHLHLWLLTPWIPERDDHRIESIAGGKRRPTTPCLAPRRLDATRSAWGWAEMMRRERCGMCVTKGTAVECAEAGAWGWARATIPARKRCGRCATCALDRYYASPSAPWHVRPAVERRAGLRTWWANALTDEGAPVDDAIVNISLRKGYARATHQFREVQKPNGLVFRERKVKRIEIRTSAGEMIDYFEGWCLSYVDRRTWELAGPAVIAGVAEALEGRRLSQSSKVLLRTKRGTTIRVGFLGIADAMYDASCRDCDDAASLAGGPPPDIAPRFVQVTTWQRYRAAALAARLPPARGPPIELAAPPVSSVEDRIAALVKMVKAEERLAGGEIARMLDVCATIRLEGPDVLPIYARYGFRRGPVGPMGMRERFRRKLRAR